MIDRADSEVLAIRIKIGMSIGINRTVLRALQRPKYLLFWWNETGKVFAISGSGKATDESVSVPRYFYCPTGGCRLKTRKLLRTIKAFTGWADGSVHPLIGEFVPDINMVVFPVVSNIETTVFHTKETETEGVYEQ